MNSGHYSAKTTDYISNRIEIQVINETEKAYKVERFVEYKNKAYQVWIPKAAVEKATSGEAEYDETNWFVKKWFENRLDGFDAWFFGI